MKKLVVVVAGGSGTRMGAAVPKQFLLLHGRPVLMWTIEQFASLADVRVVLVLPEAQIAYWHELCHAHNFSTPHDIAHGGATRYDSVRRGLELAHDEELIAIHDGVRPLVSRETIERTFADALAYGTAIPVLPSVESVRITNADGTNHAIDRQTVMMVQTPQVFRSSLLREAYNAPFSPLFTDDASVMEAQGHQMHLCQGNPENIKLTKPSDMIFAEALLSK